MGFIPPRSPYGICALGFFAFLWTACGSPSPSTVSDLTQPTPTYLSQKFPPLPNNEIGICTFNIYQLGHQTTKDHKRLANLLENCDVAAIQEMNVPPWDVTAPNGDLLPADVQSAAFVEEMGKVGFDGIWLSEEDTGYKRNHTGSTGSEWFVFFYKKQKVEVADDLPVGFLSETRFLNPNFDRVPYAVSLRSLATGKDFVLISNHLTATNNITLPDGTARSPNEAQAKRITELWSINAWIQKSQQATSERDFIILGDMNIEDRSQLDAAFGKPEAFLDSLEGKEKTKIAERFAKFPKKTHLESYVSMNESLWGTNVRMVTPFDHIMYDPSYIDEDKIHLEIIDLRAHFGDQFDIYKFRQVYSDHLPLRFAMVDDRDDD